MAIQFVNGWIAQLTSTLPAGVRQLPVPSEHLEIFFDSPVGTEFRLILVETLEPLLQNKREIIGVVRTQLGIDVSRGLEGTGTFDWVAGDIAFGGITAEIMNLLEGRATGAPLGNLPGKPLATVGAAGTSARAAHEDHVHPKPSAADIGVEQGATKNKTDNYLLSRGNHTGTQPASTISDFQEASESVLDNHLKPGSNVDLTHDIDGRLKINVTIPGGQGAPVGNATPKAPSATPQAGTDSFSSRQDHVHPLPDPLAMGLEVGATKNKPDSFLLNRGNHTGTQLASTISDLSEATQDMMSTFLVPGTNIQLVYDDNANTLRISSSDPVALLGSATPRTPGVGAPGSAVKASREDHVHPVPTPAQVGAIPASEKGVAGGVATLNNSGVIPAAQLPSFVDDVVEAPSFATLPPIGESGKIYITVDNDQQWRWSGNQYVPIYASPGTTDNVPEGELNLYHTAARVLNTILDGIVFTVNAAVEAGDGLIVSIGKLQAQITSHFGMGGSDIHPNVTAELSGFMSPEDKVKLDGIAELATQNLPNEELLDRSFHTGTQLSSTISDLDVTIQDKIDANIIQGEDMLIERDPETGAHTFTALVHSKVESVGVVGGVLDLSAVDATSFLVMLTDNVNQIILPAGKDDVRKDLMIRFTQDGLGSHTVIGWSGVRWEGGAAPIIDLNPSIDTVVKLSNFANSGWFGFVDQKGGEGSFQGGTLTKALNEAPVGSLDLVSTMADVSAIDANSVEISGTTVTQIVGLGSLPQGSKRTIIFKELYTLIHDPINFSLVTNANIETLVDDKAEFLSLGNWKWVCLSYTRADGRALVGSLSEEEKQAIIDEVRSAPASDSDKLGGLPAANYTQVVDMNEVLDSLTTTINEQASLISQTP